MRIVLWTTACLGLIGCQAAQQPAAGPTATTTSAGFAAVAGQKGGQDQTGPYEVVAGWPKPLSQ